MGGIGRERAVSAAGHQLPRDDPGCGDQEDGAVTMKMIGSFLGKVGVAGGSAREMMRASAGVASRASRAMASRYRVDMLSSCSRRVRASRSRERSVTSLSAPAVVWSFSASSAALILSTRACDTRASFSKVRTAFSGRAADLGIDIGELGGEFLDAGMARQQRPRFQRDLRAQRGTVADELADQIVVGDVRRFERAARRERFADELGARLAFRLRGPRGGELGVHVGELLLGQRRVVGADEESAAGPELLNLGFSLHHLGAQRLDGAEQPGPGGARRFHLGAGLRLDEEFGDRVRAPGRQSGIGGVELDRQHPGLRDGKGEHRVPELLDELFGRRAPA